MLWCGWGLSSEPVGRWRCCWQVTGKLGAERWLTKTARTTSISSIEQCWAVVTNAGARLPPRGQLALHEAVASAELSEHRLGAPAVAEPVGQLRGFSAALNFGAGVALGAGGAVHAGTVAATRHTGFVGIVVGACGVGDAVRWTQRGLGDPLR